MRKSSAATLALTFLSGACSLIPPLDSINSPVSAKFPGNTGGEVSADIGWQKFFTDPRLRKLVQTSLDNNRDLRIATLNVEQSRAQYAISRGDLFPTISGNGIAERKRALGSPDSSGGMLESGNYGVSVGLVSYELDLFGKVRSLNSAALETYFASDAARVGAQISLVAEVANQYLAQRALEEQIALSQQTYDGFNVAYDIIKKRFDSGTVSELELSSMEVQRQTAKVDLATFRQRSQEITNSLVFLAGGSIPNNLPAGRSLDQVLVAPVKAGVLSDLMRRRPDIREAEHQLRAANANIGAARAAFFPSVSLTSDAGTASRSLSGLFANGTGTWLFSPQINVPIFSGGINKAVLDSAELSKQVEIANYEKAIQTGFREVADSLAARSGLAERITATEGLVAAQQKRTNLATARFEKGVDSYFEVLTATLDLFDARQSLIRLRLAREINAVNLYKALGGGW
ncbi:MAG: efflux transporter outer membrane subunit [Luteolibacter sp.]|uniref:efflux transporter outer membrane subunit n=1 Tax=Luteolibacter sp. TaxID=1962973 RepID=UPI00326408E5